MGSKHNELRSQRKNGLAGMPSTCSDSGGFLLVGESNFQSLPQGACVRIQSVSFSKLQAGDYILIEGVGTVAARRFVKLTTDNGITRLVVADGTKQQQSIPFPRLVGLIQGVKADGDAFNPNPQGFFQRVAFKLSHTFSRSGGF